NRRILRYLARRWRSVVIFSPSRHRGGQVRSFAREDRVQLAAGFVDDGNRLLGLLDGTAAYNLHDRVGEVGCGLRQGLRTGVVCTGSAFPRRRPAGRSFALASLSEGVGLSTVCFCGEDEPLICEQLEGRVDGTGAGLPRAAAALID